MTGAPFSLFSLGREVPPTFVEIQYSGRKVVTFAELQERVNRYAKLDLYPLFTAYKAQTGSENIEGFVEFLSTSRVIDASVLKELYTASNVEIPSVDDPSLAGTRLAAWSQAATNPARAPEPAARAEERRAPAAEVRYQPLAVIGQGAMGAISIARDLYLRRMVALKTVLPEMAAHPQLLGRFLSEMQITAQLEHPNIVPIYGLEIGPDGTLGYAMKLVQGQDLAQLLTEARAMVAKGQPLDGDHALEKRIEYFLKVCDALEVAHQKGIIHRDLKPANVMVGGHNEVYLMDWGIARPMGSGGQALEAGIELHQADGEQGADLTRTRIGSAIGTASYMSPEQAAGRNAELDGRSDQYAMGLILQECVSLKRAVQGTTLHELLTKAKEARRDPVEIGDKVGNIPRELAAIVHKATQLRPEDRYPSVRALADDVRRYLRNEAVEALPDSALRRTSRWVSKHRMASLTIMLSLGLAGAAATIGSLVVGQARVAEMHARELRTSEFQTESAIQAQLVDRELARYESALTKFVGAAQRVLAEPTSDPPAIAGDTPAPPGPFFDDQLRQKGTGPAIAGDTPAPPADYGPSSRYGHDVSVLSSVVSLAPGVAREPLESRIHALGALSAPFRELLIGSGGGQAQKMSAAQQRDAIAGAGVPALRAVVGFADGVTLTFPAAVGLPTADFREDPMYKLVGDRPGVFWGAPVPRDGQMVLPVGAALYAEQGFRGVAVLDVSLDRLLEQPGTAKLDYVQSKLLVSRAGKVMAEDNGLAGRAPLAPEVLDAMAMGRSGSLETQSVGHNWVTTYYPLSSVDWYYVAVADRGKMLSSKAKVTSSDPRKVIAAATAAVRRPAAPPPPAPVRDVPDAGDDAGDDAGLDASVDAGLDGGDDAGLDAAAAAPDAGGPLRKPGPMPQRSPFDTWGEYDKGKKK